MAAAGRSLKGNSATFVLDVSITTTVAVFAEIRSLPCSLTWRFAVLWLVASSRI